MSYLVCSAGIPKLPERPVKAVISLWFRVPAQTVADITAEHAKWYAAWVEGEAEPARKFLGIVPVMTFGPTDLKARKFYFQHRMTGFFPGMVAASWQDGSGLPSCIGAGWVESAATGAGPFMDGYYSFDGTTGGAGGDFDLNGCYIGVDCRNDPPVLSINLVMPVENKAVIRGSWPVVATRSASAVYTVGSGGVCPGHPQTYVPPPNTIPGRTLCFTDTYYAVTSNVHYEGNANVLWGCVPETFRLLPPDASQEGEARSYNDNFVGAVIAPDRWHHLLLSFDFTSDVAATGQLISNTITNGISSTVTPVDPKSTAGSRTASTCRVWIALDDINLTGPSLSCYWPEGGGDNDLLPVNGYNVATNVVYVTTETGNPIEKCDGIDGTHIETAEAPGYNFTPAAVDFGQIGLPASSSHVDAVRRVEMAELQMWSGEAVDTAKETTRRAFIDFERDAEGKIIIDSAGESKMQPVTPKESEELLGRTPDVLLHNSSNWQSGYNTGSIGVRVESSGNIIKLPEGQFEPTARIEPYKPDPAITVTV